MSDPQFLVAESTLTDRYQTTVPASIRKALGLGKQDKIAYRLSADGVVQLSRVEEAEDADPVIENFLEFIADDMEKHPEHIRPVSAEWAESLQKSVTGVEVGDLEQPLPDDDE